MSNETILGMLIVFVIYLMIGNEKKSKIIKDSKMNDNTNKTDEAEMVLEDNKSEEAAIDSNFPYKAKYLLTKTEYVFFKQLQINKIS